jgi:hypothetical protein
MFSFRFDKAGFFSGLVLMSLLGGTVVASLLIWLIGGWNDFTILLLKWLWGTIWVLLIVTVLVRLAIYRWQMLHGVHPHKRDARPAAPPPDSPDGPSIPVNRPQGSGGSSPSGVNEPPSERQEHPRESS